MKFKVGDKVKVVKNDSNHGFDIDTVVNIVKAFPGGEGLYPQYFAQSAPGRFTWFVLEEEIEHLVKSPATIYEVGDITTHVRQWTFPGGEVGVDINIGGQEPTTEHGMVVVRARIQNSDDVMALIMATDALRRHFLFAKFALDLAYIPYARQDRVCNPGEAHSLKVFAGLINGLGYDFVEVLDPHSSVSEALINNLGVISQFEVFGKVKNFADYIIVAPDQGALKKVEDFARRVGAKGVISFNKTRNLSDGKIIGIKALDIIKPDQNYLVLDDICDGGRTFTELAKKFHDSGHGKLELMVTHGIFSKGVDILLEEYDHVYTTNSFRDDMESTEKLTVVKLR